MGRVAGRRCAAPAPAASRWGRSKALRTFDPSVRVPPMLSYAQERDTEPNTLFPFRCEASEQEEVQRW
jgi:hypothetical protein